MLTYQQALNEIVSLDFTLDMERLPLLSAEGRRLAGPIVAPWPLPRFSNSSMDGFAVVSADLAGASEEKPAALAIGGESAAGSALDRALRPGECVRISTGAEMPPGADAVVPIEIVQVNGESAQFAAPARAGQYVRQLGSDVAEGQSLFARGTLITPAVLSFLAYYNIPDVEVIRRPRVGILSSGDEILPHGTTPTGSQIIGSSVYYLERELAHAGCEARLFGISPDDLGTFKSMFSEMLEWADVLVTTAGVSVGEHDIVGRAVGELGGEVLFWRVAVRPGKPFLFARFGGKFHFGFPGNPVSTCCNTEIFLKPFLRKAFGMEGSPQPSLVRLGAECPRDKKRLFFVYTRVEQKEGEAIAYPLPNQNSGNLLLPALANALVIAEPGEHPVPTGGRVAMISLTGGL